MTRDNYLKLLRDTIDFKCNIRKLNPQIINVNITSRGLLIIDVPAYHTFVKELRFKGVNKNIDDITIEAYEHIDCGLDNMIYKTNEEIENDFADECEKYDGLLEYEEF